MIDKPDKSNFIDGETRISEPGEGRGHPKPKPGITTGQGGSNTGGNSGGTKKP